MTMNRKTSGSRPGTEDEVNETTSTQATSGDAERVLVNYRHALHLRKEHVFGEERACLLAAMRALSNALNLVGMAEEFEHKADCARAKEGASDA